MSRDIPQKEQDLEEDVFKELVMFLELDSNTLETADILFSAAAARISRSFARCAACKHTIDINFKEKFKVSFTPNITCN